MGHGNGYEVSTAALAEHATDVEKATRMISVAGGAAHVVGVGTFQMYGVLCSPLMGVLSYFFDDIDDAIKKTAELGNDCAAGLRTTKQSYEDVERELADLIRKIG